jgi:hypothetical protein
MPPRARGMAQAVECLICKCEAINSNLRSTKKKEKWKRKRERKNERKKDATNYIS